MSTPVLIRAKLEWRIEEKAADGFLVQIKRGMHVDEMPSMQSALKYVIGSAKILETRPQGSTDRFIEALYEAK